ncbi:hypothetical protein [Nonomuraea sp. LPB2021202275-12-8]
MTTRTVELVAQVSGAILAEMGDEPAPGRGAHLLSTILFPTERPPPNGRE